MTSPFPYPYSVCRSQLVSGQISCRSVVEYFLKEIGKTEKDNIYLEVYRDEALERADFLDRKRDQSPDKCGLLFGMVVSLKDVLCFADHRVSAGSRMLEDYTSPFSATAVDHLLNEDAIIIGRTNCDEFAMGSANEFSAFGSTQNPTFPGYVTGGSSGGAAAAVAARTCHVALGSDTGGSVRQPASFCEVIGLKPTYGRVSRYGLIAYGSSLDQIGLLGIYSEDISRVLEVIAGADEKDPTTNNIQSISLSKEKTFKPEHLPIGILKPKATDQVHPEIRAALENTRQKLEAIGHPTEEVSIPMEPYLVPCYYVLATAEASSNLARYDGVRYGYRSTSLEELRKMYRASRTEGFGSEVKRRILLGAFVLSSGYYDAYYRKAQQARAEIRTTFLDLFSRYKLLLLPTSPIPPWPSGQAQEDPTSAYLSDIYTVIANLAGFPAASAPVGRTENGLPIGMQWMAAPWQEDLLLQAISEWETSIQAGLVGY